MMRINATLELLTSEQRQQTSLRPVTLLAITPSVPLDALASRHVSSLPLPIKTMLSAIGATERRGGALASYLLFEGSYTRSLIELGQIDTLSRRDEVLAFFGIDVASKKVLKRQFIDEALPN
jgi:NTE family protein